MTDVQSMQSASVEFIVVDQLACSCCTMSESNCMRCFKRHYPRLLVVANIDYILHPLQSCVMGVSHCKSLRV
jgi:hypothetical protein